MKSRDETFALVPLREFDLIVIGSGIVGAGIAQDAASRGLSVIIIDKDDFASGTSSRTTKLIHGGLRYLERLQLRLTWQLCQERTLLEHLAPHLVRDFSFVLPLTKGDFVRQLKWTLGLTIYDLLSLNESGCQPHKRLSRKAVLEAAPALSNNDIVGGLSFHDAITDDSRLVLSVLKSACTNGALAVNYLEATGFGIEHGRIRTIDCHDRLRGQKITLRCKACINATGVWADQVTSLVDNTWGRRVLPAKGIHIMLPQSAFETNTALFLPAFDNRYVFVIPWQRAIMIGTTDTPYNGNLNEPLANTNEIDYLLHVVNEYNGRRRLNRSDVIATWAGLRPLVERKKLHETTPITPEGGSRSSNNQAISPSSKYLSREQELFEAAGGMIVVVGGKLTNYRIIANQVLDKVLSKFPELSGSRASKTARMILGGWLDQQDYLTQTAAIATKARRLMVEAATIDHLIGTYGKDAQYVLAIIEREPQLNERICADFPPIMAEIPYCINEEMTISLTDLLTRRIRLAQLHHAQSLSAAPKVARLMQQILNWSDQRLSLELAAFESSLAS